MSKKTNLLQEAKELNIPRRNCMQTKKQELKKARARKSNRSFGNYTSICTECLNKLRKQEITDDRLHNQKLMENTVKKLAWDSLRKNEVVDGGLMIGKKTGEILGSVADYTFLVNIN